MNANKVDFYSITPPPKKKTKPVFVGEIRSRLTKVHTVQIQMTQKMTDDRTD